MSRSHLRVADVLKQHWSEFCRNHPVESHVRKVMDHLRDCRSAVMGGHLHRCTSCDAELPVYNSCQDRHCPTCQTMRKQQWIERRQAELLPVPYFHAVFTLPHQLNPLIKANPVRLLNELFSVVAWVLQHFAEDPQWKLRGQLGFIAVLHTWTQKLLPHYHLHCLIPGGAWDAETKTWRSANRNYLFGKDALAKAFQARFIKRLQVLRQAGHLRYDGLAAVFSSENDWNILIEDLWKTKWIVYPKATARKPEQSLDYLGRYTRRVAVSDHRLISLEDGAVTFEWRDRANKNELKQMTLPADEFIARFIVHVLPHGFTKVRFYGWLSGRKKARTLGEIRVALKAKPPPPIPKDESTAARIERVTGLNVKLCPRCKNGTLTYVRILHPSRAGP